LVLQAGSTKREFVVGGSTYGNRDIYVMDKQSERVFVIKPQLTRTLKFAQHRLPDRNLVSFNAADLDRIQVKSKAGEKTLIQHDRRNPTKAYWSAEGNDKGQDSYRSWANKLLKLNATEYVDQEDKIAGLEEVFAVGFARGSKKLGTLRLLRGGAPSPAAPGSTTDNRQYYVQSSNTRVLVRVADQAARSLASDLTALLK
jgi:hypothetical protein